MKNKIMTIAFFLTCNTANADFWATKIEKGVMVTSTSVRINIGSTQPIDPNPTDLIWTPCKDNWVYIDRSYNQNLFSQEAINRLTAIAVASSKSKSYVRLNITRDSENQCYTSQIWDTNNQ